MNIDTIENKVDTKEPLSADERTFLEEGIFNSYLKDDDPKYDQANQEWLKSVSDEDLLKNYKRYVLPNLPTE